MPTMNLGLTTRHEDREPIRPGIVENADQSAPVERTGREASYRRLHSISRAMISRSRSEQCAAQSATKCSDASIARNRCTFSPDDGAGTKFPKKTERCAFILSPLADPGDGGSEEAEDEPGNEAQAPAHEEEGCQAPPERDRQLDMSSSVPHK